MDAKYTCERCGHVSTTLSNLKQHYNRKWPCAALVADISPSVLLDNLKSQKLHPHVCNICDKGYTSRQGLYAHKKQFHSNVVVTTKEEIANMIKTEVDKQMHNTQSIIGTVNIHNQNIQTNNLMINMKSFGFENIAHLETDRDFMTHCFLNKDVMGLIENIHCDRDHPENHNIRIKSTKKELVETFVDGRWIVSDQEEMLDELLNKGYRIMNFFSYRNKDHILQECDDGEIEYHEMRDWLEELHSNSKVRKPLKKKLLILFMNNKTLFLEKRNDDDELCNE
jgi:hypothetical protein